MKLLHYSIIVLLIVGLVLSIYSAVYAAFLGIKGIEIEVIAFEIGIVFFYLLTKLNRRNHSPLLLDFLLSAVAIAPFFMDDIPSKIYPTFICWLCAFILDIVYWFLDRQYEGHSIKQLVSLNFRLTMPIDTLILIMLIDKLPKFSEGEWTSESGWLCLIIVLVVVDFCRQSVMIKRGTLKTKDL